VNPVPIILILPISVAVEFEELPIINNLSEEAPIYTVPKLDG
jgi:hypothetical protein